MPATTPLDRAMNSKNLFLGFAGMVTAVAAWSIWGTDVFPAESDPKGDPETWTVEDMKRWLRAVWFPKIFLLVYTHTNSTAERALAKRNCDPRRVVGESESQSADTTKLQYRSNQVLIAKGWIWLAVQVPIKYPFVTSFIYLDIPANVPFSLL
ncbi:hypothetical protein N7528_005461 [Penicillium herquei]|nr:hypothetical protein N7528_005461 [Penicillium herquei]